MAIFSSSPLLSFLLPHLTGSMTTPSRPIPRCRHPTSSIRHPLLEPRAFWVGSSQYALCPIPPLLSASHLPSVSGYSSPWSEFPSHSPSQDCWSPFFNIFGDLAVSVQSLSSFKCTSCPSCFAIIGVFACNCFLMV
ncbi:hypothetical protein R3P38DRAFT_2918439, partial [Favolaschia claudopus]